MDKTGKILRIAAIILLGLTAAMNLLGGAGTSCAAFSNNIGYRMAFKELMDYRWLYQALVVTTILVGFAGVWGLIQLVRGSEKVFRNVLIILVVGSILAAVHYFASMALRGKAAPANVKMYINVFTLIVFLIFTIPGIRSKIDFSSPGNKHISNSATGMTAIIAGVLCLTVFHWAGPSHTYFQQNWTYVFYTPLVTIGLALTLWGGARIVGVFWEIFSQEVKVAKLLPSESK
jgi:hypothetical protein